MADFPWPEIPPDAWPVMAAIVVLYLACCLALLGCRRGP